MPSILLKNKSKKNYSLVTLLPKITIRSQKILPVAGYFVLLFALIDYLAFLVPVHLFDPNWELETIGKCVENIWSLLLGLVMVFTHRKQLTKKELKCLAWLSRLVLILAFFYFLIAPLAITSSVKIHRYNIANFNSQLSQQNNQYQQQISLFSNATEEQLTKSIVQTKTQTLGLISPTETPQELKQRLLSKLKSDWQKRQILAQTNFQEKKWNLVKSSVKWAVGGVLSGVMLIWIWVLTDWCRQLAFAKKQ